jgi:hypothetical protein
VVNDTHELFSVHPKILLTSPEAGKSNLDVQNLNQKIALEIMKSYN